MTISFPKTPTPTEYTGPISLNENVSSRSTINLMPKRLENFRFLRAEFRRDPLQPIRDHFSKYVIVGMGLFVEGYTLFSVGNMESLFESVWPQCWKASKSAIQIGWQVWIISRLLVLFWDKWWLGLSATG